LTVGALAVPHARAGEAAVGDTSKGSTGLEEVRISASQDVGHHSARGSTGHKHAVGVDVVVLDGITDGRGDGDRITTTIVSESLGGVDVPASSAIGCVGVDDHESLVAISKIGVLGA